MKIEIPVFNCFPLRLSWSPCYVTTDFESLCQNIFGGWWTAHQDKLPLWDNMIDLNLNALEHQEKNGVLLFRGTIKTDEVGVFIKKES